MPRQLRRSIGHLLEHLRARGRFLLVILMLAAAPPGAAAQTAADGFAPAANGDVRTLAVLADGRIGVGGAFTQLNSLDVQRLGRLERDGSYLGGLWGQADGPVNVTLVEPDGRLLIGGAFTQLDDLYDLVLRNGLARINVDGTVDLAFDPGANGAVNALARQADGRILVGGSFTMLGGGGSGATPRYHLGRLNPDGSVDSGFDPGANGTVLAIVVQPDGKILVAGDFTLLGGGGSGAMSRRHIGRLNADGTVDTSFDPGADLAVSAMALQPDGKILVGGTFLALGGSLGTTSRLHLGRLNTDGTLDAFNPGANGLVSVLALQPDGRILVGGAFTMLGGGTGTTLRSRIGRINADGSLDLAFNPGANGDVAALAIQDDDKILVGGSFTTLGGGGSGATPRSRIGRLYPDGSLDADLDPGASARPTALAIQPDGKIVVGGEFVTLGGSARSRLGRLLPDGSLDPGFDPGANGPVYAVVLQPDGRILVGGQFSMLGGGGAGATPRNFLGRLNPDGSLDASFAPGITETVRALLLQPDGKIVVGAGATDGLVTRYRICRLNPDGAIDTTFDQGPPLFSTTVIHALALQTDGKILVGGDFTLLHGGAAGPTSRNSIARLESNGSLDLSFNPGANGPIRAMAILPNRNNMVLVGGQFTALGGGMGNTPHAYLGLLQADGTVYGGFAPEANAPVLALAVQTDGSVVVAGEFTALSQTGPTFSPRARIGRYLAEGGWWLDYFGFDWGGFDPGANGPVHTIAVQADGKVIAGGDFTTFGGGGSGSIPRNRLARGGTGAARSVLDISPDGGTIAWWRSGGSAELSDVRFEVSTDGVVYTAVGGAGVRVAGGWQTAGAGLPLHQNVWARARGLQAGSGDAGRSLVEAVRRTYLATGLAAPVITQQPVDTVVLLQGSASLAAAASGSPLPSFRWEWEVPDNDGQPVWEPVPLDEPNLGGLTSAMLYVVGAMSSLNTTRFRVVATNAAGAATSAPARILVSVSPLTELINNGSFANGMVSWGYFATPSLAYLVWQATGGVLKFYRLPPPPGTPGQGVVMQQTYKPVVGGAPLVASFQMGNNSSVRKRVSVLLHESDFSDLSVCTFWLAPNAPLATYVLETHTTKAWTNLTISFYAATANLAGDTGFYILDNVSVQYVPAVSATRTRCVDPTAPAPPGGSPSGNLIANGDFASGTLAPWGLFGGIQSQIAGGVFEFIKLQGLPAGVVLQATGLGFAANEILTATFDLGNSSTVRKRVTVIMHDNNFTDLSACTFWLDPGQPLSTYTYRAFATQAWSNATFSVYPATVGPDQWIRLDNVTLRRTPSEATTGAECLEPGSSPDARWDLSRAATARAPRRSEGLMSSRRSPPPAPGDRTRDGTAQSGVEEAETWSADGFTENGEPPPGAAQPSWSARGTDAATHTLAGPRRLLVANDTDMVITFYSWLTAEASRAEVQVSADGLTWDLWRRIAPSDTWTLQEIDLSALGAAAWYVRFVLVVDAALERSAPDVWRLGLVSSSP